MISAAVAKPRPPSRVRLICPRAMCPKMIPSGKKTNTRISAAIAIPLVGGASTYGGGGQADWFGYAKVVPFGSSVCSCSTTSRSPVRFSPGSTNVPYRSRNCAQISSGTERSPALELAGRLLAFDVGQCRGQFRALRRRCLPRQLPVLDDFRGCADGDRKVGDVTLDHRVRT